MGYESIAHEAEVEIFHWYACGPDGQSRGRDISVWPCDREIFLDG